MKGTVDKAVLASQKLTTNPDFIFIDAQFSTPLRTHLVDARRLQAVLLQVEKGKSDLAEHWANEAGACVAALEIACAAISEELRKLKRQRRG